MVFFVAVEFALVAVRRSRLEELIKKNKPLALLTKKAIDNLNDILSTCQLGITISSLLLGWIGERFIANIIEEIFKSFQYENIYATHSISVSIAFILITFLHIVLGELVPKTLGLQSSEKVALLSSLPLFFFHYLLFPFSYFFNLVTNIILKLFKIPIQNEAQAFHSPEELKILIEEQSKQKGLENQNIQILHNSAHFSEHQAKDVMTHRTSIISISKDMLLEDFKNIVAKYHFSRYPVYEKINDKIVGVVHVQSLINWFATPKRNRKERVTAIMKNPVFVPETLSIEIVLQKLRQSQQHLSIVIDEYGGVAGILTLEDIIEEIFGQIQDETDQEEKTDITQETYNTYRIDGETELEDLKDKIITIDEKEIEGIRTISGFIIEKLKEMPQQDSYINISGGKLIVEKMEGNKIISVLYEKTEKKE